MASDTEIANLALSHLGVGKEIANINTETSEHASAARRFFDTTREAVLRDFAWPFATKIADLGLVTDEDDDEHPTTEWSYSYRYPTDCLMLRRIVSGTRNDARNTRTSYKLSQDSSGKLIFTDMEEAQIEYTMRIEDPAFYPADFILAFSFRLAAYMAPRLTKGDPFKLGERALRMYEAEISRARASAGNEEQPEEHPDSEFIRARE